MLDVFLTIDVEIWCEGWSDLDAKFPRAFKQYVYGDTAQGQYGLPYHTQVLRDHGLPGVFFVEPLFAKRFGLAPLREIIGLLTEARQEIQLHLHPEWSQLLRGYTPFGTDALLSSFPLVEQQFLIREGVALLRAGGGPSVDAFRAGSFAVNETTLNALAANNIMFDSSYNASMPAGDWRFLPGPAASEPMLCRNVYEYPITVFRDGSRSLRHAQVGACSYRELEGLLWRAFQSGRSTFVILMHNFEFLNRTKDRPDHVVVDRMKKLCRFLDQNRDCFRVRGFRGLEPVALASQPDPLSSSLWRTASRMVEQLYRERYR